MMNRRGFVRLSAGVFGTAAALSSGLLTAHADTFFPARDAIGPATLVGFVDEPAAGSNVAGSGTVTVRGWVVDQTAEGWSGVTGVEVYDGRLEQGGRLVASGPANLSRRDVATFFNYAYWENSGFSVGVNADDLPWGARVLYVYAVTAGRGRWVISVPIVKRADNPSPTDTFPGDPLIRVIDPLPNEVLRPGQRILRGIALDRNVQTNLGTGVDRVEVYLGARDLGGRLVAVPQLGKRYGEAGFDYNDPRFDLAGWDAIWDPRFFGAGQQDLFVYARRAGTNVWNVVRTPVTIIP